VVLVIGAGAAPPQEFADVLRLDSIQRRLIRSDVLELRIDALEKLVSNSASRRCSNGAGRAASRGVPLVQGAVPQSAIGLSLAYLRRRSEESRS
jgi:hypothetical protein